MLLCNGRPREAIRLMDRGLREVFTANSFYHEGGNPVIESPLAWAAAVHELLLQSWGGCIRIFPGVPEEWGDARFETLRAEGAFLVSAERRGGRTREVRVRSLAGEPGRIVPGLPEPFEASVTPGGSFRAAGEGCYQFTLPPGGELRLRPPTRLA
jgi:hypothetical protein